MTWFTHNLKERSLNNLCDFNISFNPQPFIYKSFQEHAIDAARAISKECPRLYLSYSGGLDSEFVLKKFIEANLPITPVAISTSFNQEELSWAKKYCSSNGILLTTIDMPDKEFIEKAYYKTYDKGLYALLSAVPDIVHDYYGGVVLTGNPSPFDLYNPKVLEFCEYDFYEFGGNVVNFFASSQELLYSVIREADDTLTTQQAKAKLYGLEYRDKIKYSPKFYQIHNRLRPFNLNYRKLTTKNELFKTFNSMLLPNGAS